MTEKEDTHEDGVEEWQKGAAKVAKHGFEGLKKATEGDLDAVFKEMNDLAMTKRVLAETGIGCLVNDGNFWPSWRSVTRSRSLR